MKGKRSAGCISTIILVVSLGTALLLWLFSEEKIARYGVGFISILALIIGAWIMKPLYDKTTNKKSKIAAFFELIALAFITTMMVLATQNPELNRIAGYVFIIGSGIYAIIMLIRALPKE